MGEEERKERVEGEREVPVGGDEEDEVVEMESEDWRAASYWAVEDDGAAVEVEGSAEAMMMEVEVETRKPEGPELGNETSNETSSPVATSLPPRLVSLPCRRRAVPPCRSTN